MGLPKISRSSRAKTTKKWRRRRSTAGNPRARTAKPTRHTLKLSPQEQLALALGLENLKPPAMSFVEKSSTVPFR